MKIDRGAYHVGGNFDLSAVEHVQQPRKPFFESVFVPLGRRQIGIHRINPRHWAFRSAQRLSSSFHLHRYGNDQTRSVRPERAFRFRLWERGWGSFAAESLRLESVRCRTNRDRRNGTIFDEVTTI